MKARISVDVIARWESAWPEALSQWGSGLRLGDPVLLVDPPRRQKEALAWFDLSAFTVTINLAKMEQLGLLDRPVPILAHEIGHHVLAPADRMTSARIIARCSRGLVDMPSLAAPTSNMWTDTLINDRLQRQSGLPMDQIYGAFPAGGSASFAVWMRGFELLWSLPTGSLARYPLTAAMDADALLLSRHTRAFARDPVAGAAGFAALLRRWYILDGARADGTAVPLHLPCQGEAGGPVGQTGLDAVALDDTLAAPVVHPAMDPRVNPELPQPPQEAPSVSPSLPSGLDGGNTGQGFGPSDLTDLYAALGLDRDAAIDWYVARAQQHLVPFPTAPEPIADDEEQQGWETWNVGDDLSEVDWTATTTSSPVIVPGQTTLRRIVDRLPQSRQRELPLDLDLYIDSSGSMPNPRQELSPSVLAGVVVALSALRAGARVQATVWASADQVSRTSGGFTRDRTEIVRALLHYWGGGTVFPLQDLARDHPTTESKRRPWEAPCHICVISDYGVVSMFGWGQSTDQTAPAADALASAGGGGSLILRESESICDRVRKDAGDYVVYAVPQESDLVPFAKAFARARWGQPGQRRPVVAR